MTGPISDKAIRHREPFVIDSTRYIALRSGHQIICDLQTLLARAGESGPHVLAGHSIGGALAMLYASQHNARVVGLVLVESVTQIKWHGCSR